METERFARADALPSGAAIVDGVRKLEADRVDLAVGVARFAGSGEWGADGAVSISSWMRDRCRMSNGDASRLLAEGRFLNRFTELAEAVISGRLSLGQVTEIRTMVHPRFDDLLAQSTVTGPDDEPVERSRESQLIDSITGLSIEQTRIACNRWKSWADGMVPEQEPLAEPERMLSFAKTSDGGLGRFVLDAEGAAQFEKAIEKSITWRPEDTRTLQQRQADALRDLCAFVNANFTSADSPRTRANLELFGTPADLDVFHSTMTTFTGDAFRPHQTQALLCDCIVHRILKAGLVKLDYGSATRVVSLNLWRVLALRDGGCRFPGCDRPTAWCERTTSATGSPAAPPSNPTWRCSAPTTTT